MGMLLQDVRYMGRLLRRNLACSVTTLVTLAVGIGATTAVFSVVYGILLRPLPYPEADRIVRLSEEYQVALMPRGGAYLSNITYYAWTDGQVRTLDGISAYTGREYTVGFDDEPARLQGAAVSPNLFSLVGITPAVGRFFLESEGAEPADGAQPSPLAGTLRR